MNIGNPLVKRHTNVYCEYVKVAQIETDPEDMWVTVSESLMSRWLKYESGELVCPYDSFSHLLRVEIGRYEQLIEDYKRGNRTHITGVKNIGGRWIA